MASGRWFSPAALLLVVAGGAVGVGARAALTLPLDAGHPLLVPAVTAAVNIAGSFLLGLVVGGLAERHPALRLFLGTGVLGGFTTYSAFAVHAVTTFTAAPVVGMLLVAVSVFAGAVAAGVGLIAGRQMAGVPDEVEAPEVAE
ncbi:MULTISPECIES: fluoride efflux transporter FluC [Microbacterium]|uniref:Fluoride-specific ion channel FluC n=1 Tax=Microbacterium saccharophilum TaxID=1213358 RepID=A0A7Z7D442_9MICO|nr:MULTISPECIES: CrcB family protein [Microbacterium]SFI74892.1 CrcB protein [Microbacterium saccharophilum]